MESANGPAEGGSQDQIHEIIREICKVLKQLALFLIVLYLTALLVGTHMPPGNLTSPGNLDKLLHFVAYAGLSFLVGVWLSAMERWNWRTILLAFLGLAVLAGLDELTQPWAGRIADWYDWHADLLGLMTGFSLWSMIVTFLPLPGLLSTGKASQAVGAGD